MGDKRQKKQNGNGDFARNRVFEVAAEVFHRKGYDNTSMSDVAAAAGLTKAGLYHHISSKESLLYTVLDYGLDLTEAYVLEPLKQISDPLERLKTMIDLHLRLVLQERNLEVYSKNEQKLAEKFEELTEQLTSMAKEQADQFGEAHENYVEAIQELDKKEIARFESRTQTPERKP